MANVKPSKEEEKRKNRRQRRIVVGVLISALVVIGIVSIMRAGISVTNALFDDSAEKKAFESRISTLVMLEILPFDSLNAADEATIMQACIWSVLFNDDVTKLAKDDMGSYLIPAVDVDRHAAKLFGPDFHLTHHQFTASDGLEFVYNQDTQTYTMPITGMVSSYTPVVEKIKTGRGVKRVTVGYIPPSNNAFMGLGSQTEELAPTKYYDYIFTKNGDEYYLSSIEESEMKPAVSSSSASSQTTTMDILPNDPNQVVEDIVGDVSVPESSSQAQEDSSSSAE